MYINIYNITLPMVMVLLFATDAYSAPLLYTLSAADHLAHLCLKHHDSSQGSRGARFILLQHTRSIFNCMFNVV